MTTFIGEVFEKIKNSKDEALNIKLLKDNNTIPLKQLLFANFSPTIKFLLPETATPYKKSPLPVDLADTNLFRETKKLYLFIEGGHPTLQQVRREQLWIQLLEGVSGLESEVLEALKNKSLEAVFNISRKLVDAAFPNLIGPAVVKIADTKSSAPIAEKVPENKTLEQQSSAAVKPKLKRGRKPKNASKVGDTI